jgi:hypothetical protein
MRALKNFSYNRDRPVEDQLGDFVDAEILVAQSPKWMGQIKLLLSVFINFPEIAKDAVARHSSSETSLTAWMRAAIQDGFFDSRSQTLSASSSQPSSPASEPVENKTG